MKRYSILLLMVIMVFSLHSSSWAQCPEDSVDLGECDTLHIYRWPRMDTCFILGADTVCINNPGENFPCFYYVPLMVTHDSNTFWWHTPSIWVQDSIAAFTIPLTWTRTNPSAYCSLSAYWNTDAYFGEALKRSIFRNTWWANRMLDLQWHQIVQVSTSPPYFRMALLREDDQRWWEGKRTLLATLTFRVQDTMTICIDSAFWPPTTTLEFFRIDAPGYVPRLELPFCFKLHYPRTDTLWFIAYSPVDLIVTDPMGAGISLDFVTIPGADYDTTLDLNEDGDKDDVVTIPNPLIGEYQIEVIREEGVPDTATYDLGIRIDGSDMDLLADGDTVPPADGSSNYSYDCLPHLKGDVNCDDVINSADIVFLINYLFKSGPAPDPLELGDVNCDEVVNSADVVYMINYLFKYGSAPCS
jgi:hypothetical protein